MPKPHAPRQETDPLQEEVEHFLAEKEKVRQIVGAIGGTKGSRTDRVVNVIFLAMIAVLLAFDVARHVFGLHLDWLPTLFSLEIGILLVSIKIIYMIHKQTKVDHFQFWILNSIEFRLDEIVRRLKQVETRQNESTPPAGEKSPGE